MSSVQILEEKWGAQWAPLNEFGIKTRRWLGPGNHVSTKEPTKQFQIRWESRGGDNSGTLLYAFSLEEAMDASLVFVEALKRWDRIHYATARHDILGWAIYEVCFKGSVRSEILLDKFGTWDETAHMQYPRRMKLVDHQQEGRA